MSNPIQTAIANTKEARRLLAYAIDHDHNSLGIVRAHNLMSETIETLSKYQTSPAAILVDTLGYYSSRT